jgi:carbon starvation protein CstA
MGIFFSMVISSLSTGLPLAVTKGLSRFAIPHALVTQIAHLPPLDVLFAALLGYNPLKIMLGGTAAGRSVVAHLPGSQAAVLMGSRFFPQLIAHPFIDALRMVFIFSASMTFLSAILSAFRGGRYIYDDSVSEHKTPVTSQSYRSVNHTLLLALIGVWLVRDGANRNAPTERRSQLRHALTILSQALEYHPDQGIDWFPDEDDEDDAYDDQGAY